MDGKSEDQSRKTSSVLEKFIIFNDEPLFRDDEVADHDAFNHEAFAETILNLLTHNKPPLSIGLFGSWGIGKSTIINILRSKIREKQDSRLKDIYFNAWKYSGDSFRRQFLIEVAQQIYGDSHDEVRRIRQLNYSEVLKKTHQQNLTTSITQALRDAFSVKFAFRGNAVARLIIGCASVLACVALSSLVSRWSASVANFLLAFSIPAIFVWFSGMKFDEVFVLHEEPIHDPKLIFPEQFEAEFKLLANSSALKGRSLVIAIDDIDRCEPAVIKDILISAKNFIGHENCFFIVPCDDRTVIDIFTEPSQQAGYRDESLRKYFNVTLRIPPITSTDLVDFANTVARQTGIADEIVQFAVLANCRDARKMKHFLNSLEMKYQVAKAREAAGVMPQIVDANLPELAKVVLIENAYPHLFSKLVENPRIFGLLEKAALGTPAQQDLDSHGLRNWASDYPGLGEVLERTQDIPMGHADVLFPLKSTNTEVRIPRGTELKIAITEGNTKLIEEIASEIPEGDARVATADLLADLLNRSLTGPFLRNAITAALGLYSSAALPPGEKTRVGRGLLRALLYKDRSAILSQTPSGLLRCAKETGPDQFAAIVEAYYSAIEKIPTVPDNLSAIVRAIYAFSPDRLRFATLLNTRLETWSDTPEGLSALEELSELSKLPEDERIPGASVIVRILNRLATAESVNANLVRRKILFANWDKGVAQAFVRILTQMLNDLPSEPETYTPEIEFVISSVLLQPQVVDTSASADLWPLLSPLFGHLTDPKGNVEIIRAAILFASKSGDTGVSDAAQDIVLGKWLTASDIQLRQDFEFVTSIATQQGHALFKKGLEQEIGSIQSEMQQPTDRTMQRVRLCFDSRENLDEDTLEATLISALDATRADALSVWLGVIEQLQTELGSSFLNRTAIRCLEILPTIPSAGERQELLLHALVGVLPKLLSDDRRLALREYFALMRDPQPSIRSAAASKLKEFREASSDNQDFRLAAANLIKHLRDEISTRDLLSYQTVFDALLAQPRLLGEYQNRDLANMAKALMSETEDAFQELGLRIVEQMPQVPIDDQAEIVHLLIGIAGSPATVGPRASSRLRQFSPEHVPQAARQELDEWLNSQS